MIPVGFSTIFTRITLKTSIRVFRYRLLAHTYRFCDFDARHLMFINRSSSLAPILCETRIGRTLAQLPRHFTDNTHVTVFFLFSIRCLGPARGALQ